MDWTASLGKASKSALAIGSRPEQKVLVSIFRDPFFFRPTPNKFQLPLDYRTGMETKPRLGILMVPVVLERRQAKNGGLSCPQNDGHTKKTNAWKEKCLTEDGFGFPGHLALGGCFHS
jgi:hypothetical protein